MSNETETQTVKLSTEDMLEVIKPILDIIGKAESDNYGDSYNVLWNNQRTPQGLTNMTIDEVLNYQSHMKGHTAAGRYQFNKETLDGLKTRMDLTGNELFDETMQGKLALKLMEIEGLDKYLNGEISQNKFMYELAGRWAGLPEDMGGLSHYGKDGTNEAHVDPEPVIEALDKAKANYEIQVERATFVVPDKATPKSATTLETQAPKNALAGSSQYLSAAEIMEMENTPKFSDKLASISERLEQKIEQGIEKWQNGKLSQLFKRSAEPNAEPGNTLQNALKLDDLSLN